MRDSRAVEIILIVFGAVVLALVGDNVPDRSRLIAVSGQLRSLEKVTGKLHLGRRRWKRNS